MTIRAKLFEQRHWRLGLIAAAVVVVVTSIPQVSLMVRRGDAWQGSYALTDFDELAYSAYVNAIVEGRPRRNNPYLARESDQQNIGESYFSIQSLPAYAITLPARALGISTSTAFILLTPLMAFVSSLAVFWLFFQITRNGAISAVGVLIVLLCGRLTSENPLLAAQSYTSFAFLRRYLPAVPFPLFFLFCGFMWRAFIQKSHRWALSAGFSLVILIFSYFYLWTAAAAWLFCFTVLWLIARAEDWRTLTKSILIVAGTAACALVPYLYLLLHRAGTIDTDQALTFSRVPDLFHITEIIGFLIILVLVIYTQRRQISWRSPEALFVSTCAITPFVVFNQQVITGLTLQSFHYDEFIINYLILVSIVGIYHLLWSRLKIRPIAWAIFATGVGLATALKEVPDNWPLNVRRDQARPAFRQLTETNGWAVFDNSLLAASALTDSSVPQLWTPNMHIYGGVTDDERRERFFQYLYLLGVQPETFAHDLQNIGQVQAAVFGLSRVNRGLTHAFTPITGDEIRAQVDAYSAYAKNFSAQQASRQPLAYVVTSSDVAHDFANLDRWYTRSAGEQVGDSVIYRVQLKQ
jgi:hypothetical protein